MEFDNDRARKHTNSIEIFYWIFLAGTYPLINGLTLLAKAPLTWPVLWLVSIAVLPAYFFYSRIAGPSFFHRKWRLPLLLLSVIIFLAVLTFLFCVYTIVTTFTLSPAASAYFTFSDTTIIREGLWIIINMVFGIAIYFIKAALEERNVLRDLQKDNVFFKLRYLRAQLNPHFLFNTLNSIYSLSLQKADKTPEVVIRLADLMRYLVYECNEEKIPLEKEIQFIENYIAIEKVRYEADIKFTVEGNAGKIMIEPFLFIAFIENAFKHALDSAFADPFIYITLKVSDTEIVLNVINSCDTGLDMQAKRMNGKGISNSKHLLELLYPNAYALDIIQTDREEDRKSELRMRHARERLETLYPDAYTLDTILNKRSFTVSLIIKSRAA